MLQPKIYVKDKNKVYDAQVIDYKREMVIFFDNDTQCAHARLFEEIEFMENTGYADINKKHICVGDIVEILGVYFEIKYRTFKGYVIENEEHILSLEANLDSVSVVGNIYENKELLGDRV